MTNDSEEKSTKPEHLMNGDESRAHLMQKKRERANRIYKENKAEKV